MPMNKSEIGSPPNSSNSLSMTTTMTMTTTTTTSPTTTTAATVIDDVDPAPALRKPSLIRLLQTAIENQGALRTLVTLHLQQVQRKLDEKISQQLIEANACVERELQVLKRTIKCIESRSSRAVDGYARERDAVRTKSVRQTVERSADSSDSNAAATTTVDDEETAADVEIAKSNRELRESLIRAMVGHLVAEQKLLRENVANAIDVPFTLTLHECSLKIAHNVVEVEEKIRALRDDVDRLKFDRLTANRSSSSSSSSSSFADTSACRKREQHDANVGCATSNGHRPSSVGRRRLNEADECNCLPLADWPQPSSIAHRASMSSSEEDASFYAAVDSGSISCYLDALSTSVGSVDACEYSAATNTVCTTPSFQRQSTSKSGTTFSASAATAAVSAETAVKAPKKLRDAIDQRQRRVRPAEAQPKATVSRAQAGNSICEPKSVTTTATLPSESTSLATVVNEQKREISVERVNEKGATLTTPAEEDAKHVHRTTPNMEPDGATADAASAMMKVSRETRHNSPKNAAPILQQYHRQRTKRRHRADAPFSSSIHKRISPAAENASSSVVVADELVDVLQSPSTDGAASSSAAAADYEEPKSKIMVGDGNDDSDDSSGFIEIDEFWHSIDTYSVTLLPADSLTACLQMVVFLALMGGDDDADLFYEYALYCAVQLRNPDSVDELAIMVDEAAAAGENDAGRPSISKPATNWTAYVSQSEERFKSLLDSKERKFFTRVVEIDNSLLALWCPAFACLLLMLADKDARYVYAKLKTLNDAVASIYGLSKKRLPVIPNSDSFVRKLAKYTFRCRLEPAKKNTLYKGLIERYEKGASSSTRKLLNFLALNSIRYRGMGLVTLIDEFVRAYPTASLAELIRMTLCDETADSWRTYTHFMNVVKSADKVTYYRWKYLTVFDSKLLPAVRFDSNYNLCYLLCVLLDLRKLKNNNKKKAPVPLYHRLVKRFYRERGFNKSMSSTWKNKAVQITLYFMKHNASK